MRLDEPAARERLARVLAEATGAATADIAAVNRLRGGAVQENWLILATLTGGPLAGRRRLVLRTDAAMPLGYGLDRAGEFAVLRAVFAAGLRVPEPLYLCRDVGVLGRPFFLMRWLPGIAEGERVVAAPAGAREALAERLGRELATLHRLCPPRQELALLGAPPEDAAQARIAECARFLASRDEPHPVAEWGLRWLIRHAPPPLAPALCHGDFRTGNYLAEGGDLVALLDWEFAAWSDPYEDIGWFCLRCWRFGAWEREAGGLAPRASFYRGYAAVSGRAVEPERVRYWEVMAALRWLVIALLQRDRFLVGGERSLDLALTGRRPAECEYEILRLTEAA